MPRKQREKSVTGIYHVMLRGINKQDIFLDEEDKKQMVRSIEEATLERDPMGKVLNNHRCSIYAYAILTNHVHILLREGTDNVSVAVKRIENRFVAIYNKKYEREGHLFQGPFRSEAVNTPEYFHVLLRYIHRNPIKAGLCTDPADYPYCSWSEYVPEGLPARRFCNTRAVMNSYDYATLRDWVMTDVDDRCLDMDDMRAAISEELAWEILSELSDCNTPDEFRQLGKDHQLHYIRQAYSKGVSIRQSSRLSSLTFYYIQKELKINQGV